MKQLIAPSLLAADFMNLQRDVEMINQSEADWLHLDIMDGVFVPNISFGFPVLKGLKKRQSNQPQRRKRPSTKNRRHAIWRSSFSRRGSCTG